MKIAADLNAQSNHVKMGKARVFSGKSIGSTSVYAKLCACECVQYVCPLYTSSALLYMLYGKGHHATSAKGLNQTRPMLSHFYKF